MIFAALIASALIATPGGFGSRQVGATTIVLQEPASREIAFAASIPLISLGDKDRQLLMVAVKTLTRGSDEYPVRAIRQVTNGQPVECDLLPDSVLIRFTVPKGAFKSGLSVLYALMTGASFNEDDLNAAVLSLSEKSVSYWSAEADPRKFNLAGATHDDVWNVYRRVIRPDKATVVCSGPLDEINLPEAWAEKMMDWKPAPEPDEPDISLASLIATNSSGVTDADLRGKPFIADDPSLPTRLLALYALGSGKGSSLFRISREKHLWSYRQEALLWPTLTGWEPRLYVPMIPTTEAQTRMETLQKELLDDVKSWTAEDRQRALGMAEATLEGALPYGPVLLNGSPPGKSQEDRTALAAYWRMKTGREWDPVHLVKSMGLVNLDELKETANDLVSSATITILPGD